MKARSLIIFVGLLATGLNAGTNSPATAQSEAVKPQAAGSSPSQTQDSTGSFRPGVGTVIVAEFARMVEAKKLKVDDKIECRVSQDLLYQGKIIIPRDARVIGRVTEAIPSAKEQPQARLGMVFEKIVLKDKRELAFQYPAIIVALAAPIRRGVVPTTRPDEMPIQTQKGMSSGGALVNALDNNASLAGANMPSTTGAIGASNRGVIGLKDLVLVRDDTKGNVIVSPRGNINLAFDTQVVLRVVDPNNPK